MFAIRYRELANRGFDLVAFDELVAFPLMREVATRSLTRSLALRASKLLGPATRTTLLADLFDGRFYGGTRLEELASECRFVFNAANATTGVRFGFERDVVGDYVTGLTSTSDSGLRVADAVAASAAVPGFFATFRVPKAVEFPCGKVGRPLLLDGGVYDNLGLEPLDRLDALVVALNAGGVFRTGIYGGLPVVRDLKRANSLLYRQSTALRMRSMVERFQAFEQAKHAGEEPPVWGRRGVLFGLATTMAPTPEWQGEGTRPDDPDPEELAFVKTSFGRFTRKLVRRLVYRGWWLAGANLAAYHRDVLSDTLPVWDEVPGW